MESAEKVQNYTLSNSNGTYQLNLSIPRPIDKINVQDPPNLKPSNVLIFFDYIRKRLLLILTNQGDTLQKYISASIAKKVLREKDD